MEQGSFSGKVGVITGSATGIGAAIAIALARAGANVLVNYTKSKTEAEETGEIAARSGAQARVMAGDVARDEDCRRLAHCALDAWGRIDILVNNAGTTKFAAHHDLDALTAEDFTRLYTVNVVGPFQMIRACREALNANGEGAIVNISSIAGTAGVGSSVAYAASKGALNTMTISLARALAPRVRVNAICPGYVATRWFRDRFGAERFEKISLEQAEAAPLKRAGQPQDIADAALFLCGPASRHITGELLLVDGGLHLSLPS
ncbi:MAG TPA: glucose 1-dehydrogenase [Rhizomicrobium sp.]|jgi:3-oxoacyl-[acyl-carrier protein] reductase